MSIVNLDEVARDLVVVGASAGGIEALHTLFCALPPDPPLTLGVVLHRSPYFESNLPAVLARRTDTCLLEPCSGQRVERGKIYVAPRDRHLTFRWHSFQLDRGPKQHHTRPAIDPLFQSAAREYGRRVVGVLLTGGGQDGTAGMIAISKVGGVTIIQDPREASHPWMPLTALRRDHVDLVLPLVEIAPTLLNLAAGCALPTRETA